MIARISEETQPPSTIKKADTLDKWYVERHPEVVKDNVLKTSFDGLRGRICCIGFKTDSCPTQSISSYVESPVQEKAIIELFFERLADHAQDEYRCSLDVAPITWIGHNITGFDLRFLAMRAIVLKANIQGARLPVNAKHSYGQVFDTMVEYRGWGAKAGGSMKAICHALGIEDKGGLDGSKVWATYQDHGIDAIAEYCRGDVDRTVEMYNRAVRVTGSGPVL